MLRQQTISTLSYIILTFLACDSVFAAPPPPGITQCKTKWSVTTTGSGLNFGAFDVNSGSGTIKMNSTAGLTTTGTLVISPSSTVLPNTFSVTLNNTKDPLVCGTFPFTISWGVAPTALTGSTPLMTLSNVFVSEPTFIPVPVALPVTINNTSVSLPITLTFQGDLSAATGQTAGTFTSPLFTVDLDQGGTITSATPSVAATATVLTPIGIAENLPSMNFGTVAAGNLIGTVKLDTIGGRTVSGDGQALTVGPGTPGSFTVTGEPNLTYALTILEPAVLTSGGNTMNVTAFTTTLVPAGVGTLSAAGSQTFQVGATLNLNALQPAGVYSGTYSVTVNY